MSLYDRALKSNMGADSQVTQVQAQDQVIAPLGAGLLVMFVAGVMYFLYKPIQRPQRLRY